MQYKTNFNQKTTRGCLVQRKKWGEMEMEMGEKWNWGEMEMGGELKIIILFGTTEK